MMKTHQQHIGQFSYDRYVAGESSSLARDLRRAYNELGFGRGNIVKDGMSLKNSQLNSLAERSTYSFLNQDNPVGEFTQLTDFSNPVQASIRTLGTIGANPPGINP